MAKNKEINKEESDEASLARSRAYRASLQSPQAAALTEEDKRDQFRTFWAQEKYKYGKSKDLEQILWLHLKAVKMSEPEQFEAGLSHFGLKKIR